MARSSLLALAVFAGGCDLAVGISTEAEPCELASFEAAATTDYIEVEDFSVDWDQRFAVVMEGGFAEEVDLNTGAITPIDLGVYSNYGLALVPEGNALFFTASIEPPVLMGALRGADSAWIAAPSVPRGTFAGTPSADVFGPRRVIVKMRDTDIEVQEYEDDNGHWVTVGAPHPIVANYAPNLTPNGLTMVYSGFDEVGMPGIFGATRASTDAWFGEPTLLLAGNHLTAQLLGKCSCLYTMHDLLLRKYQR